MAYLIWIFFQMYTSVGNLQYFLMFIQIWLTYLIMLHEAKNFNLKYESHASQNFDDNP
jgi:hypothetical protein